jgi:hypothetical protein
MRRSRSEIATLAAIWIAIAYLAFTQFFKSNPNPPSKVIPTSEAQCATPLPFAPPTKQGMQQIQIETREPADSICKPEVLRARLENAQPSVAQFTLEGKPKSAVAAIISGSPAHYKEWVESFRSVDEKFLSRAHVDYILFYDIQEVDITNFMRSFSSLGFEKVRENGRADSFDGLWKTEKGTNIILKGRTFPLPLFLQRNMTILDQDDWLRCAIGRWGLDYVLYAGAAQAAHLIYDEPMLLEYDYIFKVDTDIAFLEDIPFDPIAHMYEKQCIFMHSQWHSGHENEECQRRAWDALVEFGKQSGMAGVSMDQSWCRTPMEYFFGNFVASSNRWIRSEKNRILAQWLYECWEPGYFKHRWTEQAMYSQFMCQWFDIKTLTDPSPMVCNLTEWRNKVFKHQ